MAHKRGILALFNGDIESALVLPKNNSNFDAER